MIYSGRVWLDKCGRSVHTLSNHAMELRRFAIVRDDGVPTSPCQAADIQTAINRALYQGRNLPLSTLEISAATNVTPNVFSNTALPSSRFISLTPPPNVV